MAAKIAIAFAAICTLCQPALAKPAIQTVDVPSESQTELSAINDAGVIAGNVEDTSEHGVIRAADGSFTIFDPPGSMETGVFGINATGDAVGESGNGRDAACFIRSAAGVYTIFGPTTGPRPGCDGFGINDHGDSAGIAGRSDRHVYAFLRNASGATSKFLKKSGINSGGRINNADTVIGSIPSGNSFAGFLRTEDGTITTFHAPGDANGTAANSINDNGAITGTFGDSNNVAHGYIRAADGTITVVDVPNATFTTSVSINARGDITGTYGHATGAIGGFVRSANGGIMVFAPKGAHYTFPAAVNASGEIVGSYQDSENGPLHGFIRTP